MDSLTTQLTNRHKYELKHKKKCRFCVCYYVDKLVELIYTVYIQHFKVISGSELPRPRQLMLALLAASSNTFGIEAIL